MARCRYCWTEGHNRRTCPTLTERMKQRAESVIEQGFPDHYFVKEYQERITPNSKKPSQQTCSYCQVRGHTRRKCDVLQKDKEWFAKHHNEHVRLAHDYIVSSPIGIGSLFKRKIGRYDYSIGEYKYTTSMYVLTGFEYKKKVVCGNMPICATLVDPAGGGIIPIDLRNYVINPEYGQGYSSGTTLFSRDTQTIPSDWVFNQSVTVDTLASHPYFRRIGRKQEDIRFHAFRDRDQAIQMIEQYKGDPRFRLYDDGSFTKILERYTVAYNRTNIFKDFKSGK
jgi:hypothetical protein